MGPMRAQKGKTLQVVTEWLSRANNVRDLFQNPSVRLSLLTELFGLLRRENPAFLKALMEGLDPNGRLTNGSTPDDPIWMAPTCRPRRGGHLSNKGIIEALEDGRLVVLTPGPTWNPPWRKPMQANGLFFDVNSLELHLASELHIARRPSIRQQILQTLVLNFGFESLRPLLMRYAWKPRTQCPKEMLKRHYRTVTLTPENPSYLMLPGEFIHTHSVEIIGLAAVRQDRFGDRPLLAMDVGGLSFWDRAGKTNNLGSRGVHPDPNCRSHTDEARLEGTFPVELELGVPTGQCYFHELDQDPELPEGSHFSGQHNGVPGTYTYFHPSASLVG